MSALVAISIDLNKLDKSKIIEGKNGAKYVNLTLGINDETNDYGSNASVTLAQSKEEREAKDRKTFVGNGKVIWTDGSINKAEYKEYNAAPKDAAPVESDLPF